MVDRLWLMAGLLLAMLGSVACGADLGALTPEGSGPASNQTQEAAATPLRFSVGPDSIGDGLAELRSYRQSVVADFAGVKAGQTSAGRVGTLTEVNRNTAMVHRYQNIEATIPASVNDSGILELFRHDNTLYVTQDAETFWFELEPGQPVDAGEFGFLALEKLIVLPRQVSVAPTFEKIEGQNVQRFRFTEADLSSPALDFTSAAGELWVDTAGNIVVQYALSATVSLVSPLANAYLLDEGQLSLHYVLADINRDIQLDPPADFQNPSSPLIALPRLPNSRLTAVYPTLIEYTSVISPISATVFYRDELDALAWEVVSAEIFNEKSSLIFAKDNQRLKVLINPGPQTDTVKVLLDMNKP